MVNRESQFQNFFSPVTESLSFKLRLNPINSPIRATELNYNTPPSHLLRAHHPKFGNQKMGSGSPEEWKAPSRRVSVMSASWGESCANPKIQGPASFRGDSSCRCFQGRGSSTDQGGARPSQLIPRLVRQISRSSRPVTERWPHGEPF